MENNVILSVRDLDVKFTLRGQTLHAVRRKQTLKTHNTALLSHLWPRLRYY